MAAGKGKIFISYRRQETAWPARQLYEVLVSRFGVDSVFKDVDDIDPGDDFVERITDAVASCDVLLALIGNQWVDMLDDRGRRRLDNPEDFVRLELTAALSRGVRVVPILVDGAAMPRPDQLPPDLVPLTRRQAVEISPIGFNTDRLLVTLAATLGRGAMEPVPPPEPSPPATDVATDAPPLPAWLTPAPASSQASPEPVVPQPEPQPQPEPERRPAPVEHAPVEPAPPPEPEPAPAESKASQEPEPAVTPAPPVDPPSPQPPRERVVVTPPPPTPPTPAAPGTPRARRGLVLAAAALALVLLVGALLVLQPWRETPTTAGPGTGTLSASPPPGTSPPPTEDAAGTDTPTILAHRGGLEKHQFETQQALEAAAADGFWVETDVRFTSDDVAVLVHDEKATKGIDCGGRSINVSETTWADLNRYCRSKPTAKDPTKYPVPRLEPTLEGIAAASGDVNVFVEVKSDQTPEQREAFLAAPAKFGLRERTVITSARQEWLDAVAAADPSYRLLRMVSGKRVPAAELADHGLWGVGIEQGLATREYVEELRATGLTVMVWVLNDAELWARVIPYQPDIVMTAFPARFGEWLASR